MAPLHIQAPRIAIDHPDRDRSCEEALEDRFNQIMDEIEESIAISVLIPEGMGAGWSEFAVKRAICSLLNARANLVAGVEP